MRMEFFTSLVHIESTTDHSFGGITTHRYTHVPTPVEGMPMIARAAMASFPGLIREGHLAVLLEFDILASFLYDCYISIYTHIYFYKDLSGTVRNDHIVQYSIDHCFIHLYHFLYAVWFSFPHHISSHQFCTSSHLGWIFAARYEGSWQNGKQHGQGRYYHLDPLAVALFWSDVWLETTHQWPVPKITMDIYTIPYKRTI